MNMKKLIYSMIAAGMCLTGCTNFDEEASKNYGDGPAIAVNVTATEDNAFTFTLTPGEGTTYYSYVVVSEEEVESIDASALLKGQITGVAGEVLNTSEDATFTYDMMNDKGVGICSPNTSYVIYAVASNKQGVTGEVATKVIVTSDGVAPTPDLDKAEPDGKGVVVIPFSEGVTRGEGAVTAKYYMEWDIEHPVNIDAANLTVEIEGDAVTITTKEVPVGAIVCISWEAGAFKDSFGNTCGALASGLNVEQTDFTGLYFRVDTEEFKVEDKFFAPETETYFGDWATFEGTVTFEKNIYRNDDPESDFVVKEGDLAVVYTNKKSTTTVKLSPDDWNVAGKVLTFKLPSAPAKGDKVSLIINKGAVTDVYGNPVAEYSSKDMYWTYFGFTRDMFIGSFNLTYVSGFDEEEYDGGTFTIAAGTGENDLNYSNFYMQGSTMDGQFDALKGQIIIPAGTLIGEDADDEGEYTLVLASLSEEEDVVFTLTMDGKIISEDAGIFALDKATGEPLGWWEPMIYASCEKQTGATARSVSLFKNVSVSTPKVIKLPKKLSSFPYHKMKK